MTFMKHIGLFLKIHVVHLKRKCLTLPLLFMFPIIIVGLISLLLFTFISQEDQEAIQVGLVDLDESTETELMVQFLEGSSLLNQFLEINKLEENEANQAIDNNTLSTYIAFPENFIQDLYQGFTVDIPIVGNSQQQAESLMIYETMESVVRHIRSSQANILTMNDYAKQFNMDDDERNEFVFQQFQEFLFYTIGRDQIIRENEISNEATSSPVEFFGLGAWFVIITVWIFIIYHFFTKETPSYIQERMRLYGVTILQQMMARLIISWVVAMIFVLPSLYGVLHLLEISLANENLFRLSLLTSLYGLSLLFLLVIIELLIHSNKLRMLVQSMGILALILLSGAIVPSIYYPLFIQDVMPYTNSYVAMDWIQKIVLNGRFYVEYIPLLLMNGSLLFLILTIASWKERVRS